ncbi:dephospho-CoA kinase [Sphaerotilus hippei]|uniref:Dephospho-CoA kinase n=1 Tax=Sphaerotilus hippei TaxID=744406 RepID=A0A318H1Q6_9BURK|nr:dephospho-CoA kinase [Sphaerotilus hippei]PXW96968.1 dephospho-CoA kinase [Sphaerotilus hippei]
MRIGLTGGIGSGKSTVAGLLRDLGAHVIDTDAIAHGLTAPGGAAIEAIRRQFGDGMIDARGAMDRARMREQVFADPAARQRLEAILHPMIGAQTEAAARAAPAGALLVFDVPLLVESGRWLDRVDRVLVVDCPVETQVRRVMQRNGWDEAAVRRVIDQQARREQRLAVAHDVIFNDARTLDTLRDEVHALWRRWQAAGATDGTVG